MFISGAGSMGILGLGELMMVKSDSSSTPDISKSFSGIGLL